MNEAEKCGFCGVGLATSVEKAQEIEDRSGNVFEVVQIFFRCAKCGQEYVTSEQYSENFTRFIDAKGRMHTVGGDNDNV